ncbi:MAG: SH3 domain-containing protein [Ruminococcaceae bacterium]|nr:SH3 domain-containing protein [Oscillospiraceae bacterium]
MKTRGYIFGMLIVTLALAVSLGGCRLFAPKSAGGADTAATTTAAPTTTATTAGTTAEVYPFVGYVNATTLNVRPTPDTGGYAIGGLKWGDTVTILSREGDWYAISFAGQTGYINAQYVQDTMPSETTTAPETTAVTGTTAAVDTVGP